MATSGIAQTHQPKRIARKIVRISFAFLVLMAKLTLIFFARSLCVLLGIRPNVKPKTTTEKYIPVAKPHLVYLSKTDAQFTRKRDRLKTEGYLWHSGLKAWAQPSVKLDRHRSDFQEKTIALKKLGYSWNKASTSWELTFPKYQVIRVYQHKVITEA